MDTLIQIAHEIEFAACWATFRQDLTKFDLSKPCCGFTLQNGLVVIAIVDVVSIFVPTFIFTCTTQCIKIDFLKK